MRIRNLIASLFVVSVVAAVGFSANAYEDNVPPWTPWPDPPSQPMFDYVCTGFVEYLPVTIRDYTVHAPDLDNAKGITVGYIWNEYYAYTENVICSGWDPTKEWDFEPFEDPDRYRMWNCDGETVDGHYLDWMPVMGESETSAQKEFCRDVHVDTGEVCNLSAVSCWEGLDVAAEDVGWYCHARRQGGGDIYQCIEAPTKSKAKAKFKAELKRDGVKVITNSIDCDRDKNCDP